MRPHGLQPTRLPRPWDSPGKNTGVGCHFLLQCRKVKSESEVAQSCPIPSSPMDCSLPGSSVHGIFQARVLEWGAIATTPKCKLPAQSFSPNPHYPCNTSTWEFSMPVIELLFLPPSLYLWSSSSHVINPPPHQLLLYLCSCLTSPFFLFSHSIYPLSEYSQIRTTSSDGKASVYNAGDPGSIPGLGRSSGEGNGNPLQYYCLENSMDRGAW